jgi:hypothetical protein
MLSLQDFQIKFHDSWIPSSLPKVKTKVLFFFQRKSLLLTDSLANMMLNHKVMTGIFYGTTFSP